MADGRLPRMRTVGLAYRDVVRVFRAMPALVGIALAILIVLNLIDVLFFGGPAQSSAFTFMAEIVRSFLLAPFLIAVHRYVLLDEITPRFVIAPRERRFLRFFGWSWLLSALWTVEAQILGSLPESELSLPVAVTFGAVTVIFVSIVTVRLTTLFPAIAVDTPGATAANAFANTKGYFWTIFTITLMALLSVVVVEVVLLVALQELLFVDYESMAELVVITGAELVGYPLFVAIASRVFQALAGRTERGEQAVVS